MPDDAFSRAAERINAGEDIATVEPSLIERIWEAVRRIPRSQGQHTAVSLGAFARCEPNALPQSPEQHVAMMTRYALLDALIERGVLDEYMQNGLMRKKVFATAASFPCNKGDLAEALGERLLGDCSPERLKEAQEELRQAGYDPNHPKVIGKFIAWMRDNC